MRLAFLLLAGSVLASPAMALDTCEASKEDPQVRICVYKPNQRYVINAEVGFNVNLTFSDDERIKRPSFAFTGHDDKGVPVQGWKSAGSADGKVVADRYKNNLPIYAFGKGPSSLILVTARPDGSERSYQFALMGLGPDTSAIDKPDMTPEEHRAFEERRGIVSSITFVYPDDVKKAAADKKEEQVKAWQQRQGKARDELAAVARLKTDPVYGVQNYNYTWKGEKEKYGYLLPSVISDNGWLTQMQWPGNVAMPQVSVVNPATGDMTSVTPAIQGGMAVFAGTAKQYRFTIGKVAVMDIINNGWSAERPDPKTGTSSPDVVRDVKYQQAEK